MAKTRATTKRVAKRTRATKIVHTAQRRARSLVAKKGWQTRKRAAAKRSSAARKGWKTRRENEKRKPVKGVDRVGRTRIRSAQHEPATPRELRRAEFAVSADYRSRKAGSAVTVQVAARGPANATRADAERATLTKIKTGRSPAGWEVKIVDWRGKDYSGGKITPIAREREAWSAFRKPLSLSELEIQPVGKDRT